MGQNSIDIILKNENLINAIQNKSSVWNTELNSSEEEKVKLLRSDQWGLWTRTSLLSSDLLAWWTLDEATLSRHYHARTHV